MSKGFKKALAQQVPNETHQAIAYDFFLSVAGHNRPNIDDFARLISLIDSFSEAGADLLWRLELHLESLERS